MLDEILMRLSYRYLAIWVPRRLLPETLVCSVGGRPVRRARHGNPPLRSRSARYCFTMLIEMPSARAVSGTVNPSRAALAT